MAWTAARADPETTAVVGRCVARGARSYLLARSHSSRARCPASCVPTGLPAFSPSHRWMTGEKGLV